MAKARSLPTLNSFLRGEIAAVETYRRALTRLGGHEEANDLRACLASHERRVALLRQRSIFYDVEAAIAKQHRRATR